MKFGIIGAGQVAQAIARKLAAHGHEAALSSRRGPAALEQRIADLGLKATGVTVAEAAAADVVFLAVPWSEVENALTDLPSWNGRILVDMTNPFIEAPTGYSVAELGGSSSSEIVATHAPGARVVKALNSILMTNFEKVRPDTGKRVVFLSGDDPSAKAEVGALIESFGFAAVDLGTLGSGGRLQQGDGPLAGKDFVMLADWHLS